MALRNQPYIPLYVQDFLTDEKLCECSASSTGVYIRLMCIMHKSDNYGKILLKQKHKQHQSIIKNFASILVRNMPYTIDVIESAITELLDEGVLQIEGDFLLQKRMVKSNEISEIRAKSGQIGGDKTQKRNRKLSSKFAKANIEAITENESVIENESKNEIIIKKPKFDFFDAMIQLGFDSKLSEEWLLVRKNKKATNTETALKTFCTEIAKSGKDKNVILEICVAMSWSGYKATWDIGGPKESKSDERSKQTMDIINRGVEILKNRDNGTIKIDQ